MEIKDYIRSFEDFPVEGVSFKDTAGLCNSQGFQLANDFISNKLTKYTSESFADKIIGIDARGFIFAGPIAYNTNTPLVLARKKDKLPGEIVSKTYDLEYGTSTIEMQKDSINKKDNVIIIDDLCATGGTILATMDIVKNLKARVIAVLCIIDLPELGGSNKIKEQKVPFYSAVSY
jgi:adenine phosphoribosyltransferase